MNVQVKRSEWERRRPLVLMLLCVLFGAWFAWDGWQGWPKADDAVVKKMLTSRHVTSAEKAILKTWKGWQNETKSQRKSFDHLVHDAQFSGWHSVTDISNQRRIVIILVVLTCVGGLWFYRINRLKLKADDNGLTLANGRFIAWDRITEIDNRQWSTRGTVTITFNNADGILEKVNFDGWMWQDLPRILEQIDLHATNAKAITPPDTKPASQPAQTDA